MPNTELYQHLLGLKESWVVSEVELDVLRQRVDVWVHHPKGLKWPCPECGTEPDLYDHAEERRWRRKPVLIIARLGVDGKSAGRGKTTSPWFVTLTETL